MTGLLITAASFVAGAGVFGLGYLFDEVKRRRGTFVDEPVVTRRDTVRYSPGEVDA